MKVTWKVLGWPVQLRAEKMERKLGSGKSARSVVGPSSILGEAEDHWGAVSRTERALV